MKKANRDKIPVKTKFAPISLVNKVLEELGAKTINGTNKQYKFRLESICAALLKTEDKSGGIVASMLDKGVSIETIFDDYIPDVARLLGLYWVNNLLTFVEVTLAMARLQALASELEPLYLQKNYSDNPGNAILVITPAGEQHTFGAQMVTRKLKRLGTSPYLSINNTKDELLAIMHKQKFKLVAFSVAGQNFYENDLNFRGILTAIKKFKIPIALGGNLATTPNVISKNLGIELVTNDITHALNFFNIKYSAQKKAAEQLIAV